MSVIAGAIKRVDRFDYRSNAPLITLFVIVLIASICFPSFRSSRNAANIAQQSSMVGMISIGMAFVILSAGIDLSVGSIAAVSALLAAHLSTSSSIAAAGIPILAGIALGAVNGGLVTWIRIPPFIATLATMLGVRGLAFLILPMIEDTNGTVISTQSGWFYEMAWGKVLGIPYFTIMFLVAMSAAVIISRHTSFGRAVYAIGGNEEAARMMGLNVPRTKMLVYMISGGAAGLAGVLYASRIGSVKSDVAAGWELQAITAVVISGIALAGGIGRMSHVVYGVLILAVIPNIINKLPLPIPTYTNDLITGLLLLAAMLLQAKLSRSKST